MKNPKFIKVIPGGKEPEFCRVCGRLPDGSEQKILMGPEFDVISKCDVCGRLVCKDCHVSFFKFKRADVPRREEYVSLCKECLFKFFKDNDIIAEVLEKINKISPQIYKQVFAKNGMPLAHFRK